MSALPEIERASYAPTGGKVIRLYVNPGARVEQGAPVGIFDTGMGQEAIKAPTAGIITRLASVATTLQAGELLVEVEPPPAPRLIDKSVVREGRKRAAAQLRKDTPAPAKTLLPPQKREKEVSEGKPAPARRSNGSVPVLEEIELPPALPTPIPLERARRPKIITRTTRPTCDQATRFEERLEELRREGYDFKRSEIERVMFDAFLSLPLAELAHLAQRNRKREVGQGYGIGLVHRVGT